MLKLNVLITGVDETMEKLATCLEEMCGLAVLKGTQAGVAAVARTSSFNSISGRLKKGRANLLMSIRVGAVGEMKWNAPYASFVDEGTEGPYEIHPKLSAEGPLRGKGSRASQKRRGSKDVGTSRVALRIPMGSGWVFARYVNHPGIRRGRKFTEEATEACIDKALEEVEAGVLRANAILNGT